MTEIYISVITKKRPAFHEGDLLKLEGHKCTVFDRSDLKEKIVDLWHVHSKDHIEKDRLGISEWGKWGVKY